LAELGRKAAASNLSRHPKRNFELLARARPTSCAACRVQTFKSAIGRSMSPTSRMFVVTLIRSGNIGTARQKVDGITSTATTVGKSGAFAKMATLRRGLIEGG